MYKILAKDDKYYTLDSDSCCQNRTMYTDINAQVEMLNCTVIS